MNCVNPANWIPVDIEVHQEKPCLLMYGKNSMVLLEGYTFPELKIRKLPFKFRARLFLHQGKMQIAKAWPDGDLLALYDAESFEKLSLHGSKDRNVPLRHSQELNKQLKTKSNAYHHLEVLDGEDHEILGYENRQICLQKVQDFWNQTGFLK